MHLQPYYFLLLCRLTCCVTYKLPTVYVATVRVTIFLTSCHYSFMVHVVSFWIFVQHAELPVMCCFLCAFRVAFCVLFVLLFVCFREVWLYKLLLACKEAYPPRQGLNSVHLHKSWETQQNCLEFTAERGIDNMATHLSSHQPRLVPSLQDLTEVTD